MMLSLLLESAARSLLLGFVVGVLLKVARLRDTRTETAIWTAVLLIALAMPLLSRHVPGWALMVPHSTAAAPAGETASKLLDVPFGAPRTVGSSTWPGLAWLAHHARRCVMIIYLLGLCICAMRLAIGLLLTVRLYREAVPVQTAWVQGRKIRVTAEISGPVSLAGTILLPADHGEWSAAKRSAVLAHEDAHIARRDFVVQMAAVIHRAVFWFSPFAWWLQMKLSEIAERASDEAAIRRLNDRTTYAEILIDVSRRAQKSPLIVAMANNSFIQRRVDHILSEAPTQSLTLPQRMFCVALLAALAIAVAGAKTAADSVAVTPPAAGAPVAKNPGASPAAPGPRSRARRVVDPKSAHIVHDAHRVHEPPAASSKTQERDDHSYDPRALLDPIYTPKTRFVPAATLVHAGKEFYVRSTEKPVADVSVTYAMERPVH